MRSEEFKQLTLWSDDEVARVEIIKQNRPGPKDPKEQEGQHVQPCLPEFELKDVEKKK